MEETVPTAKKKNRAPRVPPKWIEGRVTQTVRASDATLAYFRLAATKTLSWFDTYGTFRQGARVRA
jgi:hypothetical protein